MALLLTLTSVGFLISSPALDSKGRQVRMLRLCNYPLESINSVLAASLALFEQVRPTRSRLRVCQKAPEDQASWQRGNDANGATRKDEQEQIEDGYF